MTKKQTATNEKIYDAFCKVLHKKDYNDIRIQDVLDESGIARSTFYAHYKTKEDLLRSICFTIFEHVFSHTLQVEKSHDFTKSSIFDYRHFITHIFYHLHDEKNLISAIFLSRSKDIFSEYLREAIRPFAEKCVESNFAPVKNLPEEIRINSIVENFIVIVNFWINENFKQSPENLTEYYIALNT